MKDRKRFLKICGKKGDHNKMKNIYIYIICVWKRKKERRKEK